MNSFENIRNLYNPQQPSVKQHGDDVVYREFLPSLILQPFIYCYWELKTTHALNAPFVYRVVADGCIDIFFDLNTPRESYVMGFCKKYTAFSLDSRFHYIGVRFLPTMFPQVFGVSASELSNRAEVLHAVLPATADFIATGFCIDQRVGQIRQKLDQYFLKLLPVMKWNNDNRLYNAISIIIRNNGVLDIEKDLDTGISHRQLRRLFEYYIGDSPKTFSKVVRFQNILRAKPSQQSLRKNKLFFDEGFYDQAHFIKEFKTFYGVTPARAFGR